jgi:hypothetical protein
VASICYRKANDSLYERESKRLEKIEGPLAEGIVVFFSPIRPWFLQEKPMDLKMGINTLWPQQKEANHETVLIPYFPAHQRAIDLRHLCQSASSVRFGSPVFFRSLHVC